MTAFLFIALANAGDILFGDISKGSTGRTYWFDDVVVTARPYASPSLTSIFDARVRGLLPTAPAGDADQWTLGGTSIPPNSWTALQSYDLDQSYVETQTALLAVLSNVADVPSQSMPQYVRHFLVVEDLDTPGSLTSLIRVAGVDRSLISGQVTTGYRQFGFIHGVDPAGLAWTDLAVNAAQAGAKLPVGGQRFRVTQQGLVTCELRSGPPSVPRGQVAVI